MLRVPPSLSNLLPGTLQVPLQINGQTLELGSSATFTGATNQILATSTQVVYNVVAAQKHNFTIGGSGKVEISSSGIKISGSSELLDLGTSGSTVSGATQAISGTSIGLQYNSTTSTPHKFYVAGTEKYRLASTLLEAPAISIGGTVGSSVDPGIGSIGLTNRIQFTGAGTADSTKTLIYADALSGNLFSNVPTAKYEQHRVAGAGLLSLGQAAGSTSAYNWSIGYYASSLATNAAYSGIYSATGMVFNLPSTQFYQFAVNGIEKYRLSATLLEAPSVSLGGTPGSSVDPGAGGLGLTNRIQFTGAGTVDTTKTLIHADAADGNMRIQAPVAKSIATWIGTGQAFAVDNGGIYPGKGIIFSNSAGVANSAQTQIYPDGSNGNLLINVPTGKSVSLYVSGAQVMAIDANGIKLPVSASPASNGTGTAGQISWDVNYIYVCTSANTWKRAALTGGY